MTDEQFNALAQFEDNYKTAIDLGYSRYPGRAGVDTMFNIYRDLTDTRVNMNRSCSVCILHLVQKVGKLYLAEKARREEEALKAKAVEEEKTETKPNKAKKTTKKK
jgi:hypothetical protein